VLRTVGPVYQFRHERLQALLAGRSLPAASGPQDRLAARYGAVAAQEALTVVATAIRRDETEDESGDDAEEEIAWWRVPYWVGPAPRALVIGLAAAAACWLGQLAVDPGLWLTVLSGATTLAVGLGAALAVFVPRRREVDEPDARWAFLLRHPILVLGGGAALGCSLGKSLAGLFTNALLVQLTLGLPIGVALWLLFGLVALAIDKDRREQVLTSWRSVHTNLPLVFVVGAGLGWLAAKAMTLVGTVPYWIVLTVVGAAVLGLLLVLGFARLGSGPPSVDDAPYDSWNHRRWTLLVLWFVLGGLVSNIVPESGMRAWLLVGLVPWPVGWVVALGLAVASGYVVGLMFPRSWSASLAWLQVALPRRPRLPVHLMEFLDDARDRGIVRADGPVYRFPSAAAAPVMADARSDTP
jgi:hypothetical protein